MQDSCFDLFFCQPSHICTKLACRNSQRIAGRVNKFRIGLRGPIQISCGCILVKPERITFRMNEKFSWVEFKLLSYISQDWFLSQRELKCCILHSNPLYVDQALNKINPWNSFQIAIVSNTIRLFWFLTTVAVFKTNQSMCSLYTIV